MRPCTHRIFSPVSWSSFWLGFVWGILAAMILRIQWTPFWVQP